MKKSTKCKRTKAAKENLSEMYELTSSDLGNFSNDDGDGTDENGKKAMGLDKQNNNSALTSRFFVHFFTVTARLRRGVKVRFMEDM